MIDSKAYLNHMLSMTNYEPLTNLWDVFTEYDTLGKEAIEDIVDSKLQEVKNDYKKLTEYVMFLNWKCWEHYENGLMELSGLYSDLFYKAQAYAYNHLKDEALDYYFHTTK